MLMRSAPMVAPRRIEIQESQLPDGPGAGELLVRIRTVGLCGSDLHWWHDGRIHSTPAAYPQILGHEPAGEVVEVGSGVHGFQIGDRVSLEPSLTCGHCDACISGRHNLCRTSRFMGGPEAFGFLRDYVVVPAHNADPVPAGMDWVEASLIEPVAVWSHIYELSPVTVDQTVAVMGCGSIGLIGIAMAKRAGARQILACDRVPHRLNLARQMGADVAIHLGEQEFYDAVHQHTRGRGVDIVFDAAGAPETINLAIRCARSGGHFTLVGIPEPLQFNVDLHTAMAKELSIQTIKRSNHQGRYAAQILASGLLPQNIVTHVLPLHQAQEGFELLHSYSDGVAKLVFDLTL